MATTENEILEEAKGYTKVKCLCVSPKHWEYLKKELHIEPHPNDGKFNAFHFFMDLQEGYLHAFPNLLDTHVDIWIFVDENTIEETLYNKLRGSCSPFIDWFDYLNTRKPLSTEMIKAAELIIWG